DLRLRHPQHGPPAAGVGGPGERLRRRRPAGLRGRCRGAARARPGRADPAAQRRRPGGGRAGRDLAAGCRRPERRTRGAAGDPAVQLHRAGDAADDRGVAPDRRRGGGDVVTAPRLRATGLRLSYDSRVVVDDVGLEVPAGHVLGVAGPNGSGKTTLLRMLSGERTPERGSVHLGDLDVTRASPRILARLLALVAQDEGVADTPLSAAEIVMLGRTPHLGPFQRAGAEDIAIVEDALRRVGALGRARREPATPSGGERQRVLIARALAQGAGTLLLDEPTNHLDIRYQHEVLGLVRDLAVGSEVAAVVVLHDLNLAARYCDTLLVLDGGRVAAYGVPDEVLVPEVIEPVYGIGTHRLDVDGVPHLAFHPAHESHGEPHEHLV